MKTLHRALRRQPVRAICTGCRSSSAAFRAASAKARRSTPWRARRRRGPPARSSSCCRACLGLSIDATTRQIRFDRARLPESLQEVRIENLLVAGASIDVDIARHANNVGINVRRREGQVEIIAVK